MVCLPLECDAGGIQHVANIVPILINMYQTQIGRHIQHACCSNKNMILNEQLPLGANILALKTKQKRLMLSAYLDKSCLHATTRQSPEVRWQTYVSFRAYDV